LKIHVISNIDNGAGLQRDAELVAGALTALGHNAVLCHMRALPTSSHRADLNIFFEATMPAWMKTARRHWLIPNPECTVSVSTKLLPLFERILTKTQHAAQLFRPLHPCVVHVGFTSVDRYDPSIARVDEVLHSPGQSPYKNTAAIAAAWSTSGKRPLHVVWRFADTLRQVVGPNVSLYTRIPEDQMINLQNRCRVHLCPSEYEGWGHYYHEGLAVGAMVVAHDGPPLNEFHAARRLPAQVCAQYSGVTGMVDLWRVKPDQIYGVCDQLLSLSLEEKAAEAEKARLAFRASTDSFSTNFAALFK
jgi:hypothetical protein